MLKRYPESNPPKRRDRLYIMAEILNIAKNGSLKTQIMYRANLSFAQLNQYLSFLLETELIKDFTQDGRTVYKITPKGIKYLRNYVKIKDLLKTGSKHSADNPNSPIYLI